MKKIKKNLTLFVLAAIVLGILVGHFSPATGIQMQPLGKYFIEVVKLFINPIIIVTIVTGICGMDNLKKVGRIGGKALLYFEVVTTLALLIGIAVAYLVQPGKGIATDGLAVQAIDQYRQSESISWVSFFSENSTIQVLLMSIVGGMVISRTRFKQVVLDKIQWFSVYLFKALHVVMMFSPVGAFGGMSFTIGKFGLHALLPLGKLMLCVYVTMFLFVVIMLGSIMRYKQVNIFKFLKYIKDELLVVLGTSSSEAALPTLMNKLEHMGCHRSVVGLVVPTGYSFNLDGTSIYLSMAVIFLAQVFQVTLTGEQMLTILGVLMVTSKGAAGVTGSGFIILASTLSAVKVIPVEGLALLLGVDRFMSEARAITNFIGNGVATIFISKSENLFDATEMERAFSAS